MHVVAPILADPLHYLADDEEPARDAAERRLATTLEELRSAGIDATGSVGTDDPPQAVGDALAWFPATELVVVTPNESNWLEDRLLERVRQLVPPVDQIVLARSQS